MASPPPLIGPMRAKYLRPELVHAAHTPLAPPERRIPFGWGAFAVRPEAWGDPPRLAWVGNAPTDQPARLRITVASDDREPKRLRVDLATSRQPLGTIDIRYGVVLQPFELPLDADATAAAWQEGITLTLCEGTSPLWLFYNVEPRGRGHEVLLPHLLPDTEPTPDALAAFYDCFTSLASLQQFGWMEGCVLEGLEDLVHHAPDATVAERARTAQQAHLALFFPGDRMIYEDIRGNADDGPFRNIEATLMVAALARHRPEHPAIEDALRFWHSKGDGENIINGEFISAEGSLTVAYPLSVLARLREDRELARMAVAQLLSRKQRLRVGDDIYLRHLLQNNTHTYRNWGRGVAWYMLGLTRSIIELRDIVTPGLLDPLIAECHAVAHLACHHQRDDGLWNCYLHAPETGAETSGSAGIAAALALAHRHGFAPEAAHDAATHAFAQLQRHLTPDGLLTGAAQSNKKEGGEALQRSGYRTISQTGMGLFAQLAAALRPHV